MLFLKNYEKGKGVNPWIFSKNFKLIKGVGSCFFDKEYEKFKVVSPWYFDKNFKISKGVSSWSNSSWFFEKKMGPCLFNKKIGKSKGVRPCLFWQKIIKKERG